jgi:hypothetical protein
MKKLAIAVTIALMGLLIYAVYNYITVDSRATQESTDELNRMMDEYEKNKGQ